MKTIARTVVLLSSALTLFGISGVETAAAEKGVTLEVLNPIARMEVERIKPSPRVTDLNNKRILLYHVKGNGREACERVQYRFKELFKGQEFMIIAGTATKIPLEKEKIDAIVKFKPDVVFASNAD
jgi:hypothetical protein